MGRFLNHCTLESYERYGSDPKWQQMTSLETPKYRFFYISERTSVAMGNYFKFFQKMLL